VSFNLLSKVSVSVRFCLFTFDFASRGQGSYVDFCFLLLVRIYSISPASRRRPSLAVSRHRRWACSSLSKLLAVARERIIIFCNAYFLFFRNESMINVTNFF
jgi:hypothetical protein